MAGLPLVDAVPTEAEAQILSGGSGGYRRLEAAAGVGERGKRGESNLGHERPRGWFVWRGGGMGGVI